MSHQNRRALFTTLSLATLVVAGCAKANEGIEFIAFGLRQKALAGADLAAPADAMAASSNPAGIVGLPKEYQFGLGLIIADRGYEAYGPVDVVAPGSVQSGRPNFPIPNSASVHPIDADSAWGELAYTNGGINTAYSTGYFKPPVFAPTGALIAPSAGGPFGGGFAGVDLEQEFFSLVYARRFGPVNIGFAPTIAGQAFNLQGTKPFAPFSRDPYHVGDNGYEYSFGGGFRVGALYEPVQGLRVALAGTTPMFMTPFAKYAGAIGSHGKFDVPADVSAGVAYDVTGDLTLMATWKHLFYSAIASEANPSFPIYPGALGSYAGPGFGWRDVDGEGLGIEWRFNKLLTLRAGFRHSSSLYNPQDVTINVLAPATTRYHVTGGFKYELTKNSSIDFSVIFALKNSISGPESEPYVSFAAAPGFVVSIPPYYKPGTTITDYSSGAEISLGYSYKFDAGDNSWIPTHL